MARFGVETGGAFVSVKVTGLRELQRRLATLEEKTRRGVARRSLRAGAVVIRDKARSLVPVDTGTLRKNIAVIRRKGDERSGRFEYSIGVRKLTKQKVQRNRMMRRGGQRLTKRQENDAFYWRFVEFGTSRTTARPFLRPAFEAEQSRAAAAILDTLRAELAEYFQK